MAALHFCPSLCRMAFALFLESEVQRETTPWAAAKHNPSTFTNHAEVFPDFRSLRLLLTNRKLSGNLMFNKARKHTFLFKHANNVIKKQKFIVYCTQIQRDARGPWGTETRIFCTLQFENYAFQSSNVVKLNLFLLCLCYCDDRNSRNRERK